MIAVFAAMEIEVKACLTWSSNIRQTELQGFPVYETEGSVICQTGIGIRARDAAQPDVARRNHRKSAESRRSDPGTRKIGASDRDGVWNRNRNGYSQVAAASAARIVASA